MLWGKSISNTLQLRFSFYAYGPLKIINTIAYTATTTTIATHYELCVHSPGPSLRGRKNIVARNYTYILLRSRRTRCWSQSAADDVGFFHSDRPSSVVLVVFRRRSALFPNLSSLETHWPGGEASGWFVLRGQKHTFSSLFFPFLCLFPVKQYQNTPHLVNTRPSVVIKGIGSGRWPRGLSSESTFLFAPFSLLLLHSMHLVHTFFL